MSYSVDVNVPLYASDQANPRHQEALHFLRSRASDPELFCISWPTLRSFDGRIFHTISDNRFSESIPSKPLIGFESSDYEFDPKKALGR